MMTSISFENIYKNCNEESYHDNTFINNNDDDKSFHNSTYINNNHIHFLLHLVNKKRYIGNITYKITHNSKTIDLPYENISSINKNYYDKFTEIAIKKESIYSSTEIYFYLWQLTILIYYFLCNNIDFSFYNICLYKEYLNNGGYNIDYQILNGGNVHHKKTKNRFLIQLKKKIK